MFCFRFVEGSVEFRLRARSILSARAFASRASWRTISFRMLSLMVIVSSGDSVAAGSGARRNILSTSSRST